ncbi:MAG: transketolase family protein [Bacillota bacterium]
MKSPRDAFGEVLIEIGEQYDRVVVLTSDVAVPTRTGGFAKFFPHRHFNMGICEQNMVSTAAGMASEGFIPIVSTFAVFAAGRAFDQIRQCVACSKNNVKIIATHPGLSVGSDGAIHQALEDIALMRALPNMTVLAPSDEIETKEVIREAVVYTGPVYIRVGRAEMPVIQDHSYSFTIGKGSILRKGRDITVVSHGIMTYHGLKAAEILKQEGIELEIINMASIKPIDKDLILNSASKTKAVITIEDHNIYGGLGSAVAEVLAVNLPIPMEIIGVQDIFGESGTKEELYEKHGLDVKSISQRIRQFMMRWKK